MSWPFGLHSVEDGVRRLIEWIDVASFATVQGEGGKGWDMAKATLTERLH